MVLPGIYSRRKRLAQKQGDDVYQYVTITPKLRKQIVMIFEEIDRGFKTYSVKNPIFDFAVKMMRKELGEEPLAGISRYQCDDEFEEWFTTWDNIDDLLDSIEFAVQISRIYGRQRGKNEEVSHRISEINSRMLEAGFGFQIEGDQLIQISSTFVHKEVTVPALGLLASPDFQSAEQEFRQAYQEFNQGHYDDCIHDCCNAFESVLKVILTKKKWTFGANDTASKLLSVAFDNGLIPVYMQNEFTGLRTILESGVPTVRNKIAGHGAGANPRNIPKHVAAFQLHQTAAAILLLVECAK